ncbi:HutD/Ves family protein [Pseudodonghicola xiamenensis]|uniref:HutD protein n=1 Tax=Pseudodonghicola xiamenensis TaxID=337702 RepID=A0A8J3ME20_9RHOB|nr:HutD family protein [Pseudodonghicola xiamenensis]GHG86274.1 hypothetical protein GCM10010961_14110 [Pseudodonghicola xiamenensis]
MTRPEQLLRAAERPFTPWKNGGGLTAEVLCVPQGAGFDAFDWRISTARVTQSGPFSIFPGVERSLSVIAGGAMILHFGDGADITISRQSEAVAFSGSRPCEAELQGEPLLDLNVMVRAPYACSVRAPDQPGVCSGPVVARYLFALTEIPALGLETHDLAVLNGMPETAWADLPGDDARLIEISGRT